MGRSVTYRVFLNLDFMHLTYMASINLHVCTKSLTWIYCIFLKSTLHQSNFMDLNAKPGVLLLTYNLLERALQPMRDSGQHCLQYTDMFQLDFY